MGRKKKDPNMTIDKTDLTVFRKKNNKEYVSNKDLLREIILSKEQDLLTNNAIMMFLKMAEHLAESRPYKYEEDKQDAILTAMLDIAMYWRGFNCEKFTNPFAYYTSMLTNGLQKGWNKIYGKFKASEMTSLDNNIHSF